MQLYKLLDNPIVYKVAQLVFAPGVEALTRKQIRNLYRRLPEGGRLLDVGCGPSSWLRQVGLQPIGLDLNPAYVLEFAGQGGIGVVASAENLPFATHSFDGVWTFGVLHHVPDPVAVASIHEFLRLCRPGGYVVIMDAVLPRSPWHRPIAALVRRMDRGKFIRRQEHLESLLPQLDRWSIRRCEYSYTGLEVVFCVRYRSKERA